MGEQEKNSAPAAQPKKRIVSIDIMRTLAIIGMVLCHFPLYLSTGAKTAKP